MKNYLDIAIKTIKKAGEILIKNQATEIIVNYENGKDIKLQSDLDSEKILIHSLFEETGITVLSEEYGILGAYDTEALLWVVDPLDGSLNFSRGIYLSCISVGLWQKGHPVLGVIYNFNNGDLFKGMVGGQAFLNNRLISVSNIDAVSMSVICTGFPVYSSFNDASLIAFISKLNSFKKIRLLGSAALSLSLSAQGSVEVYIEEQIGFWDVAAGIPIIMAAGGVVKYSFYEDNPYLLNVIASNGLINIDIL